MTYRTTRRADQDIIDIYVQGVLYFGVDRAERYHRELVNTFDLLAKTPHIARERTEFDPPVRMHPHQAHIIVYTLREEGILIVRVLHGRRDWETLLEDDGV